LASRICKCYKEGGWGGKREEKTCRDSKKAREGGGERRAGKFKSEVKNLTDLGKERSISSLEKRRVIFGQLGPEQIPYPEDLVNE